MFRHLFVILLLSLLWFNFIVPKVQAERSELDKQIESFHETKDEKDFARKVNRNFQSENSLERFLGDSGVWDRLNHYKLKFNTEYQTIIKVFTTETDVDENPSGIAILVDKIQVGDSLEDLDSCYTQCNKFRDELEEKEIKIRSIEEKITLIDLRIQANVLSELEKLQSNDQVVKYWINIQQFPVVYQLTGDLFAEKYVSSLTGTSSELLASWQSAKAVLPSDRQEDLKEALISKISLAIQKEVKELDSTSGLLAYWNALKRKDPDGLAQNSPAVLARLQQTAPFDLMGENTEEILVKWNILASSEDFNASSAKEFHEELQLAVNKSLTNQFPKDLFPLSSTEQFVYWTKLNENTTFKGFVFASYLNSLRNALEKQMFLSFEKEIQTFKNCDDCLAKWEEFRENVTSFATASFDSTEVLVQNRLLELLPENLQSRKTEILAMLQKNFPEFKPALKAELTLVQNGLDQQDLAEWKNQLKGKTALEIVQMWNSKQSDSDLNEPLKNSMKLAAQSQIDVCFTGDLNSVEPAFANYADFQTKQKNGGTFDLAFNSGNLISRITSKAVEEWEPELETLHGCENVADFWFKQKETPFFKQIPSPAQKEMQEAVAKRIRECFVEDWKKVRNPSYANYLAFLDELQDAKIYELAELKSQNETIRESFAEAWKKELAGKSPSEVVSLWESVQNLPYFEILPKAEMRDLMASQFGICIQKDLQTVKSCETCSEYWEKLKDSMLKAGFKPSIEMDSMAVARFNELLNDSFPENKNESLAKINELKSKTDELFQSTLDEKYKKTKITLNENYLDWWEKHLKDLTCTEMLDEWKKNENEFRTYDLSLQDDLKTVYDEEFLKHFAIELEKNRQKCTDCISFWQNLLNHGFVAENDEEEQILQIFTEVLNTETPSNLEGAQNFLNTILKSTQVNSIFKPILNKKLAGVQQRIANRKEFQAELPKLVQNLKETSKGVTQFEKRVQDFETRFPEFSVHKELHELDQQNRDSINTIFTWNRLCNGKSLTQEQTRTNLQLIPEWNDFTAAFNIQNFAMNNVQLKYELIKFFNSTKIPHWSQYPYNGNDYYITSLQAQKRSFGIIHEGSGDYTTTVRIEDPSLIQDAYHHQVFNEFNYKLNQLTDAEIQQNPQILYDFILKTLKKLKTDSEIHPAYAAYGICKILKAVQNHSILNRNLDSAFCISQNQQLMENFEENFDFSRFRKVTFFKQDDRLYACNFLEKSVIPSELDSITAPDFTPYTWVGMVDSDGNFLTVQSNDENLLMLKNGKLVPAEKGSTGSLLFLHQKN